MKEKQGYLIMTRRVGESIMIGNDIEITINDIQGGQVRIGVNAPREIEVHRKEVYQRIQNGEPRRVKSHG